MKHSALYFSILLFAYPLFSLGKTNLKDAVFRSDMAQLNALTERGANLNKGAGGKKTALRYAVSLGRYQVTRFLLDHHVNLNQKGKNGRTSLMQAIIRREKGIVLLLLKYHPDLDVRDKAGMTALHYAVVSGQGDLVKLLLAAGAADDIKDKWKVTAAQYAGLLVQKETFETMNAFQKEHHVPGLGDPGVQVLLALESGEPELLDITFRASGVIAWLNNQETDPISLAAAFGNLDSIRYLLTQFTGMEPFAHCSQKLPLIAATKAGRLDVVRMLIESGSDVNSVSPRRMTPLMASLPDRAIFKTLVRNGANSLCNPSTGSVVVLESDQLTYKKVKQKTELLRQKAKSIGSKPHRKNPGAKHSCRNPSLPVSPAAEGVTAPVFTYKPIPVPSRLSGGKIAPMSFSAVLGKDGIMREIKVTRGFESWRSGFELNVIKKMRIWKYIPGKKDGRDVDIQFVLYLDISASVSVLSLKDIK